MDLNEQGPPLHKVWKPALLPAPLSFNIYKRECPSPLPPGLGYASTKWWFLTKMQQLRWAQISLNEHKCTQWAYRILNKPIGSRISLNEPKWAQASLNETKKTEMDLNQPEWAKMKLNMSKLIVFEFKMCLN